MAGRRPRGERLVPRPADGQRDLVVLGYLAVLALVTAQAFVLDEAGRTLRSAVPYAIAGIAYLTLRWWGRRGAGADTVLIGLAGFGTVLGLWLSIAFLVALPRGIGDPSGFYRVKVAVTSPIGDHNTAAGLLLPAIVAIALLVARDRRWRFALALATLGGVATLSRGAAIVLVVVVLVGWAPLRLGPARWYLLGVGATMLAGVLVLAAGLGAMPPDGEVPAAGDRGPEPVEPAEDDRGPVGPSVLGRIDLIVRGFEVGAGHPALGVGLGGFVDHSADLPPPNDHAHNLLSHAFAEGGIVLLLVAAGLPVVLVVRAWQHPEGAVRGLLLVGGAALVLHAQHDILGGLLGYELLLAILLAAPKMVGGSTGSPATGAP